MFEKESQLLKARENDLLINKKNLEVLLNKTVQRLLKNNKTMRIFCLEEHQDVEEYLSNSIKTNVN
jgi:hypothetical protein